MDTIFPTLQCAGCKLFRSKRKEKLPSLCFFFFNLICTQMVLSWAQILRTKWPFQACPGHRTEYTNQALDWSQGRSDLFLAFWVFSSCLFSLSSSCYFFLSPAISLFHFQQIPCEYLYWQAHSLGCYSLTKKTPTGGTTFSWRCTTITWEPQEKGGGW